MGLIMNLLRNSLLIFFSTFYLTSVLCNPLKDMQQKLSNLKDTVTENPIETAAIGAAAAYGTYKSNEAVRNTVDNAWKDMKAKGTEPDRVVER